MKNNQKQQSNLPQLDTWEKGYRLRNGKYIIEKELGRGGFGITYLAKDKKGNAVVIKTPTKLQIESAEEVAGFWENFAQEAVKLAQCSRRNAHIVELHEVVRERELPCLVMEYIEGETLSSLVKQGVLSEAEATRYIVQIGSALAEMHSQNLLHRDVKPQNIMLRGDGGGAVLIDFGIAQKFISGRTQTITPALTPGYGPPEQYEWRGKQGTYTDVYALAGTLYFALTGKVPLPAHDRIEQRSLEPPNKINPKISNRVNDAILKGMELEPRVRPQSIEDWLKLFLTESDQEKTRKIRPHSAKEGETKNLKEKTIIKLKEPTTFPQTREYPEGPVGLNSPQAAPETRPLRQHLAGSSPNVNQDKSPRYPSGSVPLGSPFYLERTPIEEQVKQEIRKSGALVRIKATREMGKTSLLLRILDSANRLGYRSVSLNLEQVDQAILSDLNKFLRWLCANSACQLQLKSRLDEYWDEDLGSKISCTLYFQDYLLELIDTPLVLALDEVNQIFEHPQVAKDFLPLLRSWYEEAKRLPIWQKLRLIVVHSTEIYVPLQLNQSPFNVGLPVQLDSFSQEEVQQLAGRYGLDWADGEEARQLMSMVGGHPALVNLALYHLSRREITLSQLLETAHTANGIYHNHLQRHWATLKKQPELAQALDTVLNATEPVTLDPILTHKLSSMGLIKQLGDRAIAGCELYRRCFTNKGQQHFIYTSSPL